MNSQTFRLVPIEQVQDYRDRSPCKIRHSTKSAGGRECFDEVGQRKYFVVPHIPGFDEFPLWQNKRVLEIDCGIGPITINFTRRGTKWRFPSGPDRFYEQTDIVTNVGDAVQ
jgi:hypothetical protein